jgi:hypothetical protein
MFVVLFSRDKGSSEDMANGSTKQARRGRPSAQTVLQQFAASQETLSAVGGLPDLQSASKIWDDIWFVEAQQGDLC